MFLWVITGIVIVVGFHAVLLPFKSNSNDLSTSLHPIRRLQHVMTGLVIVIIYVFVPHELGRVMISVPAILFLIFDILRRTHKPINTWFLSNWGSLLRPHEMEKRPPGACYFLLGIAAVFWITNSRPIANISMLTVTLCDPAASVFGILFGSIKLSNKKSLQGTLAGGLVGGLIALSVGLAYEKDFGFFSGMVISIISEMIEVPYLDDNFTIPTITCLMWEIWSR